MAICAGLGLTAAANALHHSYHPQTSPGSLRKASGAASCAGSTLAHRPLSRSRKRGNPTFCRHPYPCKDNYAVGAAQPLHCLLKGLVSRLSCTRPQYPEKRSRPARCPCIGLKSLLQASFRIRSENSSTCSGDKHPSLPNCSKC